MRIALIGATGVVGREILSELLDLEQAGASPFEAPLLFATAKTAGETVPWGEDEELVVEQYEPDALRGMEVAMVATPAEAAATIVPRLRQLGVVAIDLSRAHRDQAPLYFNGTLTPSTGLAAASVIALPSAEALQLARVVTPLRELGLRSARVTLLKAASGAGQVGVNELAEATGRLLNGMEPENPALGHRLAFNAVPQAGAFIGPNTEAELDLQRETARLADGLPISSTALWGPWFFGNVQTVSLAFASNAPVEGIRSRLQQAPQVKVLDNPAEAIYPMPLLATGDDAVLVGRLRADPVDGGVLLVSAMDNARAAASHAIEALRAVARARGAH